MCCLVKLKPVTPGHFLFFSPFTPFESIPDISILILSVLSHAPSVGQEILMFEEQSIFSDFFFGGRHEFQM